MPASNFNHEKISPTAKLVAHWRQDTDIPYAKDIAFLFKTKECCHELFKEFGSNESDNEFFSAILELRYKCIQHYLKKNSFKQVLEFASGISLRGLAMSQDPSITYVETDLPGINDEKNQLLGVIKNKYNLKNNHNLFFHTVNVLNSKEVEPALEHFDKKYPVAVTHEGLFQYLSKEEKAQAAKNIHAILKKFGGQWITPDFDTKEKMHSHFIDSKRHTLFLGVIEKATGCNFERNAFKDDNDIFTFFNELGFKVDWVAQMQDGIQISNQSGKLCAPEMMQVLKSLRLWVLSLKK